MPTSKRKMNRKRWKKTKITGKRSNDRLGVKTKENPQSHAQRYINVYGRWLSERFSQSVERKMYQRRQRALGFDAIERDALYSRICESTVPKNGRIGKTGRRKVERRKEETLKGWAIVAGHWHMGLSVFTDKQPRRFFLKRTRYHVFC